jgi:hypothetical protein
MVTYRRQTGILPVLPQLARRDAPEHARHSASSGADTRQTAPSVTAKANAAHGADLHVFDGAGFKIGQQAGVRLAV